MSVIWRILPTLLKILLTPVPILTTVSKKLPSEYMYILPNESVFFFCKDGGEFGTLWFPPLFLKILNVDVSTYIPILHDMQIQCRMHLLFGIYLHRDIFEDILLLYVGINFAHLKNSTFTKTSSSNTLLI